MQETKKEVRGCAPVEVQLVSDLHPDNDLAVRCLEYIRLNLASVTPEYADLEVEVIALCHHFPSNCYPALGIFGPVGLSAYFDLDKFSARIDAWVEAETLSLLF